MLAKLRTPEPERALECRPTWAHLHPCVHCPSEQGPPDPESEDMLTRWDLGELEKDAFSCAWRPGGLCRGWLARIHEAKKARSCVG